MTEDADETGKLPSVRFIRDEPSDVDFFQSHGRLARAMAATIKEQPELRVIGLLGDWGSGKSTVVKLLRRQLELPGSKPSFYCFEYDTWLYQSDPPRRSFLETLIYFLVSKKLTTDAEWAERLDQLNGRIEDKEVKETPAFTTSGRLLLPFLLLWPIGLTLSGYETIRDAFAPVKHLGDASVINSAVPLAVFWVGVAMLAAPAFVAGLVYLAWRPWRPLFSRRFLQQILGPFWTKHRTPHEGDTILSLLANKAIERTRSRTIKAPDPTAIEFQSFFQDIMERVRREDRRFVFVVDNLDRLPADIGLAMWGTIRSFFLRARESIDGAP